MKTEPKNSLGNIAGWTLAVSSSTIRVRPSAAFYAFCLTFVAAGAGLITAALLFMKEDVMLPLIFGAVFLLAGAVTLHVVRKKKVPEFDLMQECFYPGGRAVSIRELSDGETEKIPFREMQGLRVDSYIRGSGKNSHLPAGQILSPSIMLWVALWIVRHMMLILPFCPIFTVRGITA